MKDRIGQSNKKKKTPTDPNVSGVTGVPKPESFAGFSEDEKPPKKSKLPLILLIVLIIALVAGGIYFFLNRSSGGGSTASAPNISYPANTASLSEQQQAQQDVLLSAKAQKVPTIVQLVDLVAINELTGPLE